MDFLNRLNSYVDAKARIADFKLIARIDCLEDKMDEDFHRIRRMSERSPNRWNIKISVRTAQMQSTIEEILLQFQQYEFPDNHQRIIYPENFNL